MRLKSLEIVGFKSFVDRVVIDFEEGINSVVGPNGCGKSNIVDAIRWVMGEQSAKHLRGHDMVDVIFNGSDKRPAMGMAQVFLTFDNSDGHAPAEYSSYSEIQVGRRLYRSGESEYFINKTPCRLKDIVDLFLGTGIGAKAYSIVEQGMIGSIVSAKPDDRRQLIEEASGISKFKARKEAALRKLEATKGNLLRLDDILAELNRQLNSLNRQAKKAERYKVVSDELRQRELALVSTKYLSLKSELDNLGHKSSIFKEKEVSLSSELLTVETNLESMRLENSATERQLDSAHQERWTTENRLKLIEADISHKIERANSLEAQVGRAKTEIETLFSKLDDLDAALDRTTEVLVNADCQREEKSLLVMELNSRVNVGRKTREERAQSCNDLQTNVFEVATFLSQKQSRLERLEERSVEITSEMVKIQSRVDQVDAESGSLSREISEGETGLSTLEELKERLHNDKILIEEKLAGEKKDLNEAQERLNALQGEFQTKKSQLESLLELKKNLEGYQDGVKAVLNKRSGEDILAGVVGTVSEFVSTQPEFETALGAVLGDKLQFVLVESQCHGAQAVEYLKNAANGRGTFIPRGVVPSDHQVSAPPAGEGVIGPLQNYVSFADGYQGVGKYLVGDVVLVDNLKSALDIWERGTTGFTLATLEGEVVDPAGVITGGRGGNVGEQLLEQNRRIRELGVDISLIEGKVVKAEIDLKEVLSRTEQRQKELDGFLVKSHEEELKLVSKTSEMNRVKDDICQLEDERDQLTLELASLSEEEQSIKAEIFNLKKECIELELRKTTAENNLEEIKRSIERGAAGLLEDERDLIDAKVAFAQAQERSLGSQNEGERLLNAKVGVITDVQKRKNDIEIGEMDVIGLREEVEDLRSQLELSINSIQTLEDMERKLQEKYDLISSEIKERETFVYELRKGHSKFVKSSHELDVRFAEQRASVQNMVQNIVERYRVDLPSQAAEFAKVDINVEEEETKVSELRERLDGFGSVNVDAIAEHSEIKERFDHISGQHHDLTESTTSLQKAIQKINRTSRDRFRRTFDSVNAQFEKLFPKLFKGGRARLILTDDENVLESGVEIVAQPPGKKLQSVGLLSGGEKALTAIALIFSIFLIKPSPFCLLDEVDAPLDDVNVDRFNDLIGSMVKYSQFILITHNKRTMELADLLYGVTMEEAGVSKIVSVKMTDDEEKIAAA